MSAAPPIPGPITQLPITNQPNQTFNCIIPLANRNINLGFYVSWNDYAQYWQMTISDFLTKQQLLTNFPLITGNFPVQNFLRPFQYLGIGSAYIVPLKSAVNPWPQLNDWGNNFILLWAP